jgi:16S rRNA (cytosine967-C5)-methyltransferase
VARVHPPPRRPSRTTPCREPRPDATRPPKPDAPTTGDPNAQDRLLRLAATIVGRADRAHPADAVLRQTLRSVGGLAPAEARTVSRAVFAFHRWQGWVQPGPAVLERVRHAVELAAAWERSPRQFAEAELRSRGLPSWAATGASVPLGPIGVEASGGCPGTGPDGSFWTDWLAALQTEPPLWVRARPEQGSGLARELQDCVPAGLGQLGDALRYMGAADLFRTPGFGQGRFEIQDVHSQAVGWLAGPQPGQTWWDACAGEGGKLLHLSDLMANRGLIWATDRVSWRLQRLKLRAARAGVFNYRTRIWSGGPMLPVGTRFDGILVDAPCSNLGTWHRNPQARWTTTPTDVTDLARVQATLIERVIPALKPGGRLVYAVCTLTRIETADVACAISRAHPELEAIALTDPWTGRTAAPAAPWLWLLPRLGGGNGMFVAAWRRS